MPTGLKHLLQCHCILPQYRNSQNPVFHKFVVFSIIDDSGTLVPKFCQCNNCGVIHKIIDICKSEIIPGKDESRLITHLDDIKIMLPQDLASILENYDCDLPTYENAKFILDEKAWGEKLILLKESVGDEIAGKVLMFNGPKDWRLETFSYTNLIDTVTKI